MRNDKTRIVLDARCIDHLPYGVGRYATELTTRLPALRPDWDWTIIRQGEPRETREGHVTVRYLPIPVDAYPAEQIWWKRLQGELQPDLFHSLWFHTPEALDCPKVLTVQDMIFLKGYATYRDASLLSRQPWHFRSIAAADHIIVPSLNTFRDIAAMAHVPADRVHCYPLACSGTFHPDRRAQLPALRATLNLPADYILVSAHQSTPYKNMQTVAAALHILQQAGVQGPEFVCTGTPQPNAAVRSLGFLSEAQLAAVTAGALAIIVPSMDEGFGLPVLEGMNSGVPVICSRNGSLPEVGGEAVLYFDPDSPYELADAIRLLIGADGLRADMIQRGLQRATQFSWDAHAHQTLALYEAVLETPGRLRARHAVDWEALSLASTLPPANSTPHYRGQFYQHARELLHAGEPDKAYEYLLVENECYQRNPDVLRELGRIDKQRARWTEAVRWLEEMLSVASERGDSAHLRSASFHLADSLFQQGNLSAAREAALRCLAGSPDHHAAKELLHNIELATPNPTTGT